MGVSIPTVDKEHKDQHRGCAFIEFQHQVSVNYAIGLLNQISLYGSPMKVSYMTAGNNSGAKSVNQSPTTSRPPPLPSFNGTSPQNFLSFSDSPIADARQLIPPSSGSRATSSSGSYYAPPVSSNRDKQHYDKPSHGTSHSSSYYPRWLQHDTIRQIHDWREREQERSRQSSHQHHHHHHGYHNNGHPSSYR